MITKDNLENVLDFLGFVQDEPGQWERRYPEVDCSVIVDTRAEKILYPEDKGFKVNERETCNFSQNENFVVMECVCRLLEKGYRPESIELERRWPMGHEPTGGRADVCIDDISGGTLAIIECKTPGGEFRKAWRDTQADGAQLFSYWQQDSSTQWLVLYACDWNGALIRDMHSIPCKDDKNYMALSEKDEAISLYSQCSTAKDLFRVWDETYDKRVYGDVLFGNDSRAYAPGVSPLRKRDLLAFDANDVQGNRIVNRFEEILRHNNVSDKENAFNRLVALFIAKLADELGKDDDEEVEFQYRQGSDTYESLQDRLQRLHQEGMRNLMREDVLYVPSDYAERLLRTYSGQNRKGFLLELNGTLRKLKFYTNSDFAFKDVHNEELFLQNSKVLVEMVRLFQPYRLVEEKRAGEAMQGNQFLGDLFERLLNQGFKQNEGQFFTPIPLARFMWKSLPLGEIMSDGGLKYPKVIDYACGAAHFLTEGFEEINNVATALGAHYDSDWVKGHLVGIEKDYRLARVSRVSLFMHGAGDGEIVFGDGLDDYPDKGVVAGGFDILIANPPYSVKSFKPYLKLRNNELKTLDVISDTGSEIETAFVERSCQLLRPKGVAAIILPSPMLVKDSESFSMARNMLLETFQIKAIARMGSGTFGATGANTVILFLERFDEPPKRKSLASDTVDAVFSSADLHEWSDSDVMRGYLHATGTDAEAYQRFVTRKPDWESFSEDPHFRTYSDVFAKSSALRSLRGKRTYRQATQEHRRNEENHLFYETFTDDEKKRLRVYALVHEQRVLVIDAPSGSADNKEFLGYEWSNRKGDEGIKVTHEGGLLYSTDGTQSIADLVRASFRDEEPPLDAFSPYCHRTPLSSLIDFNAEKFTSAIHAGHPYVGPTYKADVRTLELGRVARYVVSSADPQLRQPATYVSTENMLKDKEGVAPYEGNVPPSCTAYGEGDVLVSNIRPYLKKIWQSDRDGACSKDVLVFRTKNNEILDPSFLLLLLRRDDFFEYAMSVSKGLKMPRGDKDKLLKYRIPLPPIEDQHSLSAEYQRLSRLVEAEKSEISKIQTEETQMFEELFGDIARDDIWPMRKISELYDVTSAQRIYADSLKANGVPFIRLGDLNEMIEGGSPAIRQYISEDMYTSLEKEGKVPLPGDLLVTSRGTLGRCYQIKESDRFYFQDGMITWLKKTNRSPESEYTNALFSKSWFHRQLEKGRTGTSVSYLSISDLAQIRIPVPDKSIQAKYAQYASAWHIRKVQREETLKSLCQEKESLLDVFTAKE